ncbi:MAG: EamA/RhaT family transporter, partial [Methyloligellaceae bacterium]
MAAIALMCAAVTIFAMLDATAKYLVDVRAVPVAEVIWVRFLGHLLLTIAVLGPLSIKRMTTTSKPVHQLVRSALVAATTAFNFLGV